MGHIVVGVDGSEHAHRALEWAADEARRRGVVLRALHAWSVPLLAEGNPYGYAIEVAPFENEGRAVLERAVEAVAGRGVEVEPVLVQGSPARVLLDAAAGADLLVVGSRGHGGFAGLLLGSVSQQVVHHAPCPIVVVPSPGG